MNEQEEFKRKLTDGSEYVNPDDILKWQHDVIEKIFSNRRDNLINNKCPHCKEIGEILQRHVTDLEHENFRKYMNRIKNPNRDKGF